MHPSTMEEMGKFAASLPRGRRLAIAEVGSRGENEGYRPLFDGLGNYFGLDIKPGRNVDIVLPGPYEWPNMGTDMFDVVLSGQVIEHVPKPWRWMRELARIVKPKGLVCVIGPYQWEFHEGPFDCWRVYPEGMRAVMEEAGLTVLKAYMNGTSDTVGIATKGPETDLL